MTTRKEEVYNPRTAKDEQWKWEKWLAPYFSETPLSEVTAEQVAAFATECKNPTAKRLERGKIKNSCAQDAKNYFALPQPTLRFGSTGKKKDLLRGQPDSCASGQKVNLGGGKSARSRF